ncbi:FecR family protein [Zhouia amylolytica]|uniref:Uncharacterized protein n=2 Tax=Zhouia amylolytica TaxID=376730 RepID=W2UQ61_9FLAO|nr:FecR domain-containing protein [Zhouia amylolytica]ETN96099.1 hypothetical protein P278_18210 [Zhouia amylolytica AD3]MCQ0112993.1 DUF4974 domain-containing protein [Zhouia amylolytica]SFS49366.1 FecR family protein [Zhouia amylolytica]
MHNKLLDRFIKGAVTEDERKSVLEWLRQHPDNQKKFNRLKASHVASGIDKTETLSAFQAEGSGFKQRLEQLDKKKSNRSVALRAMAIVIPIVISFMVFQLGGNELSSDPASIVKEQTVVGEKKEIILPDGSKVILNSDSHIRYPDQFRGDKRLVYLEGEALFDVTHDETKPFIVKTNGIDIKVLGTSFNVKSYEEDENIETTLITGKVEILEEDQEESIFLKPSQKATFNKVSTELVVAEVKSDEIIAWQKGVLVFNETPMKQVISDLERKYDVVFEIGSPSLLEYKYTGTFNNLTIEEVVKLLKYSSPVNYDMKGNQILLSMEK